MKQNVETTAPAVDENELTEATMQELKKKIKKIVIIGAAVGTAGILVGVAAKVIGNRLSSTPEITE